MKQSAGILLYRKRGNKVEFFLVHPGGPFFAKKQEGVWTVPKGELMQGEEPLACALREFKEETGHQISGDLMPLKPVTQKGGKVVHCWALHQELDPTSIVSNTFSIEWPPRSGKMKSFPEIDKAGWFELDEAKRLINERQVDFLMEVISMVHK
ncbi:MAG TPA: NUDIX domain-containing protein [Cytophagaceae bacterium]|jgi:predicted NUDIX family NTP pyrophosphohydrolase|nr:NUDIX domain-containing protein [Cytophagaceae bacterium]